MKPKILPVLERAIDEGVAYGWQQAHKHDDTPDEQTILDHISDKVLDAICDAFDFDDDE